jgi:hypothetical protein
VNANRVIVDLRRHRTGVPYIVSLISQYVAGLGGATVEWLLRPIQAQFVPQDHHLGLAEATDDQWGETISQHMLELRNTKGVEGPFWVLSFDNALLSKVKAVTDQGLIVTVVHLGGIMSSSQLKQQLRESERKVQNCPGTPAEQISVEEACVLVRNLLLVGDHTEPNRAFSQKDLRPKLVQLDRRAFKQRGNAASEFLIKDVVARGQSEGWLASTRLQAGKSGTEVIYLTSRTPPTSTMPNTLIEAAKLIETISEPSGKQQRASQFEGFIALARIGAIPRTRDLLFDAFEATIAKNGYEPLLLNDLLDVSMSGAKERAVELEYSNEKNWDVAGRCVLRLMCRAGVLISPKGVVIEDRIGRDSHRVGSLASEFRLICEAYLAAHIIQSTSPFNYDDDTYYLGITLYRQGAADKLSPSELKQKADSILAYLEQKGVVEMSSDHLIHCVASKAKTAPARVLMK